MIIKYLTDIEMIDLENKPIKKAWDLSLDILKITKTKELNKFLEILTEHENLFFSRNSYHNQYHLAKTIYTVAFLAKEENMKFNPEIMVLLLAATFHDVDHLGRSNKYDLELEKKAVYFFTQWWKNNSLFLDSFLYKENITFDEYMNIISDLILSTDFNRFLEVTESYKQNENYLIKNIPINKLKQLLIEADSLMLIIPTKSFEYTKAFLKENNVNLIDYDIWNYIRIFLNEYAKKVYCSKSSNNLGIIALINEFEKFLNKNLKNYGTKELFKAEDFKNNLNIYFSNHLINNNQIIT